MKRFTPTIQHVAKAADVSTATVSRAFVDPERVAEKTRLRVLSVAQSLGYFPNFTAQSLRINNSKKLLVTLPDVSNPFFGSIIRGAEDMALAEGYGVVLGDTRDDATREEQYASMFLRREV